MFHRMKEGKERLSLSYRFQKIRSKKGDEMAQWNEQTVNQLANKLDPIALARILLSALEDEGIDPTVDNAFECWLDILEHEFIPTGESVVKYSPIFASERPGYKPVFTPY